MVSVTQDQRSPPDFCSPGALGDPSTWDLNDDKQLAADLQHFADELMKRLNRVDQRLSDLTDAVDINTALWRDASVRSQLLCNRHYIDQQIGNASPTEDEMSTSMGVSPPDTTAGSPGVQLEDEGGCGSIDDARRRREREEDEILREARQALEAPLEMPGLVLPHVYGTLPFKQDSDLGLSRDVPPVRAPSTAYSHNRSRSSQLGDEGASWTVQNFKEIMDAALRGDLPVTSAGAHSGTGADRGSSGTAWAAPGPLDPPPMLPQQRSQTAAAAEAGQEHSRRRRRGVRRSARDAGGDAQGAGEPGGEAAVQLQVPVDTVPDVAGDARLVVQRHLQRPGGLFESDDSCS